MLNTDRLCLGCMNDNGGEKVCPICGYDSSVNNPSSCLPAKFWINDRYLVGKAIAKNGDGITYIGWDNEKDSIINIREYFPHGFARRNPDKTVSMVKGGEYTFNQGLMEFIEINRCIMQSLFPSLVPCTAVFEENGTTYAIYQNVSGISLRKFLSKNGDALKWEQARPLFLPLIDTIKGMNELGIIHGGISIDTIKVGRDGKLRITDYSVTKVRNTETEMTTQIYPGYAAIEQYGFDNLHIDKYTDVYGLCATLFRVLIGTVPPEAEDRIQNDSMTIPSKFAEELPRHVLSALANGLQVMPGDRTQNVEDFRNELVYGETVKTKPVTVKSHKTEEKVEGETKKPQKEEKKPKSSFRYVIISSACTAAVFLMIVVILIFTVFKDDVFKKKDAASSSVDLTASAPVVESIGSVASDAAESATLYSVPTVTGKYFAELSDIENYEKFKFVIKGKEFNDKFPKGQICAQSVEAGTNVEKETTIQVVISLGTSEIKIANVLGLDELNAKLELLKQGFLYENIKILEKYDEDRDPGAVIEQEPKYGTAVNTDMSVTIYVNSYKGKEMPSASSSASSGSSSED